MLITALDGSTFELRIVDYQFPKMTPAHIENKWDPNWLIIYTEAKTFENSWNNTGPNMTTVEAEELCAWFNNFTNGQDVETAIEFIEPELTFELKKTSLDLVTLQVKYREYVVAIRDWQHFDSTFMIEHEALELLARQWCEEIKRFPRRAGF